MGGFAAQRGYLGLPEVILVAMLGGFLGDQMYFFLGRRYGNRILARFPSMVPRAAKVDEMLYRYHAPLIMAIRFMYGFRVAGPIVLGMGRVSAGKFILFNLLGACLWAILVAGIGFIFGHALELVLEDIRRYDHIVLGTIALFGLGLLLVHQLRERKRS
jgi:membrane protein DedA with SNARE-associated domain